MSLIKTIEEFRSVIPRIGQLTKTIPNVDKAGRMHIIPIIGEELYEDLDTKVTANTTLSELEGKLLKAIQLPLAAAALMDDLAFIQTSITDAGLKTSSSTTHAPAHRWEYHEIKAALSSYFDDGIELLISFLYSKKSDFAKWTASDAFKLIDSFLIKTGKEFQSCYPIHSPGKTFWSLHSVMADVEENYLARTIGRDLLSWVKTQEEIIVTGDGGELDVKKLLKKAVANFTIKHAAEQMRVQFDSTGFSILNTGDKDTFDSGRASADASAILQKAEAANREGQNNLAKASAYLVRIAAGEFGSDWSEDFSTSFDKSPLKPNPEKLAYSNGNERRKIFRFG